MNIIEKTKQIKETLSAMESKAERRKYLLSLRKSSYDFQPIICALLFEPTIKDKELRFYILNTVANTDLLKTELAWCLLNGYGCHKTKSNISKATKILLELEPKLKTTHPEILFETDFSGISWSDSELMSVLESYYKKQKQIKQTLENKKRELINIRQWRNKNNYKIIFIEKVLPILYYLFVTCALDYYFFIRNASFNEFLVISSIMFEASLILSFMLGVKPTDKKICYRFPTSILLLPFINCIYLLWQYSNIATLWIGIVLLVSSFIILSIGIWRLKRNVFDRDFEFFKKVILPILDRNDRESIGYLLYDYGDLTMKYHHIPKRFKKYRLLDNWEDGLFSTTGLFFNGRKV